MANVFPLRFPDQLRQHLRALRKEHGLTQAQLGALVGVSQARIAEIEANPGLVNFEQLMKLLSALGLTLTLQQEQATSTPARKATANAAPAQAATPPKAAKKKHFGKSASPPSTTPTKKQAASKRKLVARPKKGSW